MRVNQRKVYTVVKSWSEHLQWRLAVSLVITKVIVIHMCSSSSPFPIVSISRSRPIVEVKSEVSFSPDQISTQNVDCLKPLENTVTVCFTMSSLSTKELHAGLLFLSVSKSLNHSSVYFMYACAFVTFKSNSDLFQLKQGLIIC